MSAERLLKWLIGAMIFGLFIGFLWVAAPFLLFFGGLVGVFALFAVFVTWAAKRYRGSSEQ